MTELFPTPSIDTAFTRQFGVRCPILCAPMFLVSTAELVVDVCRAGAVGTFPAHNFRPIENYRAAIQSVRAGTDRAFGINIIVQQANRHQQQQLEIALEEKVPLLITSLGNPKEVISLAHQAGTKVYCDVVGVEHARKAADLGADGLIAVSYGAGGHAGTVSPFALIPLLVRQTGLPVVAAGAIGDGAGMAAAFALGASAVYMGTRFIASQQAGVSDDYKQAIVAADCEDIVNTAKVDGFPGNFIRNRALEEIGIEPGLLETLISRSKHISRWLSLARAGRALMGEGMQKGSYKTVYSAGHGVGMIDRVAPVEEIIAQTMREYFEIREQLPGDLAAGEKP